MAGVAQPDPPAHGTPRAAARWGGYLAAVTHERQEPNRRERIRSFADTALALTEVAPDFPPMLVSHGLELTHQFRRAFGGRALDDTLWEELLALRRGPGTDAFLASPLPPRPIGIDLVLERAVEIRALVDALRAHRDRHVDQPLDRILRRGVLRTTRQPLDAESFPVAIRLGGWFAVIPVTDEHPRALARMMTAALLDEPRELRPVLPRPIGASVIVAIHPMPLAECKHLHRVGVDGPWLGWSEAMGSPRLGVLSAHHLVLEGPAFACLRADLRRRVRALRVALGMEAAEEDWELLVRAGVLEGVVDADGPPGAPIPLWPREDLPAEGPPDDWGLGVGLPLDGTAEIPPFRHTFALPDGHEASEDLAPWHADLPDELRILAERRPLGWVPPTWLKGAMASPPALRFATIDRGAFSFPDFAYAYCRAQHDALAVHHDRYDGQGFTFVVPWRRGGQGRASPVLCSFRTRRGAPEGAGTFKRRLLRRIEEAQAGEDLLTQVLDDVLRLPVPEIVRSAAVRFFERLPGDGGSFLTGRGLVSWIEVPDEFVDPISATGGVTDGLFAGSCHERGGVTLTCIDRGFRRDLCAVGSGIFRLRAPFDLFWQRLAFFLGQGAL